MKETFTQSAFFLYKILSVYQKEKDPATPFRLTGREQGKAGLFLGLGKLCDGGAGKAPMNLSKAASRRD